MRIVPLLLIRESPQSGYAGFRDGGEWKESHDRPMNTLTRTDHRARKPRSAARVNVEDDSVQIFVPASGDCEVVVATLDEDGRPTTVARWAPGARQFATQRVS